MNRIVDLLVTDLRYLVNDLGKDEGLIGPSLYDTAQVIRMAPPEEGIWSAMDWLRDQQQPDGGWGKLDLPRIRDISTLAAVLALHQHGMRARDRAAAEAGLAFLRRQARHWLGPLPNDIPVGAELLLPQLLSEARRAGLAIAAEPYQSLIDLGRKRLDLISSLAPRAGTTPTHSWEAWGRKPDLAVIDASGGVGHSPAASAAWLQKAADTPHLAEARARMLRYLEGASRSTGIKIPGVMPAVWPVTLFERSFALYPLLLAGLLHHPALAQPVAGHIASLRAGLTPCGIGMSEAFRYDGDNTAVAVLLLAAGGVAADSTPLHGFADAGSGMFITYPGELQPSLTTTVHAAHALAELGCLPSATVRAVVEQRKPDGRWLGDKWHTSWLYTTSHAVAMLLRAGQPDAALAALAALIESQYADGSWSGSQSSLEETAHGALALLAFDQYRLLPAAGHQALQRAAGWMFQHYHATVFDSTALWIGKDQYWPQRVSRAFGLSAMLACALKGYGL